VWYNIGVKEILARNPSVGHMKAKSLILCGPNSNPNPINIWDLDIKISFS
jgi:hypothetical protein